MHQYLGAGGRRFESSHLDINKKSFHESGGTFCLYVRTGWEPRFETQALQCKAEVRRTESRRCCRDEGSANPLTSTQYKQELTLLMRESFCNLATVSGNNIRILLKIWDLLDKKVPRFTRNKSSSTFFLTEVWFQSESPWNYLLKITLWSYITLRLYFYRD